MPGQAWKKQRHELWEQFRDHGTTTALAELLHHAAYLAPQPGLDAVINEFFKLAGHSEHYDAALIQDGPSQRSIETTFFRVGCVCGEIVDHACPIEVGADLQSHAAPQLHEVIMQREHEAAGGTLWSAMSLRGYTSESLAEATRIPLPAIEQWIRTGQGISNRDFIVLVSELTMNASDLRQRAERTHMFYLIGDSLPERYQAAAEAGS